MDRYALPRIRRGLVYFLSGRAVQAVSSAVLLLSLIRVLNIEDYGAYVIALGIVETMTPLSSFGLVQAVQYYVPQLAQGRRADLVRFVGILFFLRVLILAVFAAGVWLFWGRITALVGFGAAQATAALWVVVLIVVTHSFRFLAEVLEALLDQAAVQAVRVSVPLTKLTAVAAVYFASGSLGLGALLRIESAVMSGCLVAAAILLLRSAKTHRSLGDGACGGLRGRSVFRFAWQMAAAEWLNVAVSPGVVRAICAAYLGLAQVALFGFLQNITATSQRYLPGLFFQGIVRPVLTSRVNTGNDKTLLSHGVNLLNKGNMILLGALLILVAVWGDGLVHLLSGGRFARGGSSMLLLVLLLMGESQKQILFMALQILGKAGELRSLALLAPLVLVLVVYVAPNGIDWIVSALCVGTAAWTLAALVIIRRNGIQLAADWQGMLRIAVAVVVAVALGKWTLTQFNTGIALVMGMAVYTGALLMLGPLRREELSLASKATGTRFAWPVGLLTRG